MSGLFVVVAFVSFLAAFYNYVEWSIGVGDWGYIYSRRRNGWWCLVWSAVAIVCGVAGSGKP